jgi:hypothetical protein
MILPLPGVLPKAPIKSTPTNTSPVGATARQVGLGTRSGPAKSVICSSEGLDLLQLTIKARARKDSSVKVNFDMEKIIFGIQGGNF